MKNTILFLLLSAAFPAFAQKKEGTGNVRIDSMIERYIRERVGFPFPPLGEWKTTDGCLFNFNDFPKPTVVYVGSGTCAPCKVETPYLVQYAGKHPEFNFVYIIGRDSGEVVKQHPEFLDGTLHQNFFALNLPSAYIEGYRLNFGYPTKWVVATGGITKWVAIGGSNAKDKDRFLAPIEAQLK
jgi:thiol-disulfide isomerase/thioredoxin